MALRHGELVEMTDSEQLSLFFYEPHEASAQRAINAAQAAGFEAVVVTNVKEAKSALDETIFAGLFISTSEDGPSIGRYIREVLVTSTLMVAVVDADERKPQGKAHEMGADTYMRRPLTGSGIELFADLSRQLVELRHAGEPASDSAPKSKNPHSGFHSFEEVKDLLVIEVRRAKRYGYPISILLVRLDPIPALEQIDRPGLPREITAGLAVAISRSLRIIDLPVHYADDSILVFLPHTDLAGAEEVGRRIKRRIKRITYRDEEITCQLTASVGIAGISAGDNLSFGKLIKNATAALKAAQLKGGDRVMKRVSGRASSLGSDSVINASESRSHINFNETSDDDIGVNDPSLSDQQITKVGFVDEAETSALEADKELLKKSVED